MRLSYSNRFETSLPSYIIEGLPLYLAEVGLHNLEVLFEVDSQMADPELTDRIISQGKALVRAIEAVGTIEPTGPTERVLAGLLLAGYKRRLRAIVEAAPAWVTEEILSASEQIGDKRAVLWISKNWGRLRW